LPARRRNRLIVASRLARICTPLVAIPHLWVDNPSYSDPGWRKPVDALERWILRTRAELVTVSRLGQRLQRATESRPGDL